MHIKFKIVKPALLFLPGIHALDDLVSAFQGQYFVKHRYPVPRVCAENVKNKNASIFIKWLGIKLWLMF
jgi:hypothetical protein